MTNYRVFDGHCDTPIELWLQNQPLRENTLAVSLARAQRRGTMGAVFRVLHRLGQGKAAKTGDFLPRAGQFSRAAARECGQDHALPHSK